MVIGVPSNKTYPTPTTQKKNKNILKITLDNLIFLLTTYSSYATLTLSNTKTTYEKGLNKMTESNAEQLKAIIQSELETLKSAYGKRFSTHYEAQAHLVVDLSNATDNLRELTKAVEFLWDRLRNENFDEEHDNAINAMHMYTLLAIEELVRLAANIEKLGGGVVHEPKET